MKKGEHTPGPWTAEFDCDGINIGPWSGRHSDPYDGGLPVIDTVLFRIDRKDRASLADAYLIAAAPDLLAACEALLEDARQFFPTVSGEAITLGEAAIKKARGTP